MLPFPREGEGKRVTHRYIIKEGGPAKFKGWVEVKITNNTNNKHYVTWLRAEALRHACFFTNNIFYAPCFVLFSVWKKIGQKNILF